MIARASTRPGESVVPAALGKYGPLASLGRGGMADVFLAVARGPVGFNKRTPADIELPAGTQTLKISRDGYEPVLLAIDVQSNAPVARTIALRAKDNRRAEADRERASYEVSRRGRRGRAVNDEGGSSMRRSANRFVIAQAVAVLLACAALAADARAAGEDTTETVEQLAERAYGLQAAGKDAEAITMYLKAYELSKAGILLLNVARIYDTKMHEPALAAEFYRRYLLAPDADGDRVKKVTDRLAVLKRDAEEDRTRMIVAPPTPAPQAPPASPAPPTASRETALSSGGAAPFRWGPMRTAGVVVGALGVAGVGTSLILGYVAKTKNDSANALCNGLVCANETGVNLTNTAESFATAATVTFVAGLVLVGGGIVIYVAAPKGAPRSQSATVVIAPHVDATGTGAGVVLHGVF